LASDGLILNFLGATGGAEISLGAAPCPLPLGTALDTVYKQLW